MPLRVAAVVLLLLALRPEAAHAAPGAKVVSYQVGAGGYEKSGKTGTFVTSGVYGAAMSTKDRPIQFFGYAALRAHSAAGHDYLDLDFGVGGRILPQRPLSYSANGSSVVRLTGSASLGLSLITVDTPYELTGGIALCSNRSSFSGGFIELVFRPTNEAVGSSLDLGPWGGLRVSGFW